MLVTRSARLPVTVSSGSSIPESVFFSLSLLAENTFAIICEMFAKSRLTISSAPSAALEKISIIFAVICCPVSPSRTLNTSAKSTAKLPHAFKISSFALKLLTSLSLIYPALLLRYESMPPSRFAPIVTPTEAKAPAIFPRFSAKESRRPLAASCTAGSVNISIKLSLIPLRES